MGKHGQAVADMRARFEILSGYFEEVRLALVREQAERMRSVLDG